MRKLVAALACRAGGARLYGKPLQRLGGGVTILDQILNTVDAVPCIDTAVLGISEGKENDVFEDIAAARGIGFIRGDQKDVLMRLIQCGRKGGATDVFRVTTECPFLWSEPIEAAWVEHVENKYDITAADGAPEGVNFEIYSMGALTKCHERGDESHRSEFCSLYAREHMDEFRVNVLRPEPDLDRLDLRLTVDNPEDLVVCRRIFEAFTAEAPLIPITTIVRFLDDNPHLKQLVAPFVEPHRIWPDGNVS